MADDGGKWKLLSFSKRNFDLFNETAHFSSSIGFRDIHVQSDIRELFA